MLCSNADIPHFWQTMLKVLGATSFASPLKSCPHGPSGHWQPHSPCGPQMPVIKVSSGSRVMVPRCLNGFIHNKLNVLWTGLPVEQSENYAQSNPFLDL